MNNYGELIEPTTLRFERILPGPIERVWEYITDGEKRALWFAGGSTDLKTGGRMELQFHNSKLSSPPDPTPEKYKEFADGVVMEATVLKCEAPNLFVMEWEGQVTFELSRLGDDVKLVLTHEKLQDTRETRVGTLAGWHTHLDILVDHISGNKIEGFWKAHMAMEGEYAERIS